MNNVLKMPFSDTPLWHHLEGYYLSLKDGNEAAREYLAYNVPEPLQQQVIETVGRMLAPQTPNNKEE